MNKNETKTKAMSEKVQSVGLFLNKYSKQIAFCMMACVLLSTTAFATSGGTAESLWSTITDLAQTWITRFGGVIMFIGGVNFGLGWQSNDASQKSQGVGMFAGGAIIIAVAALAAKFFG